MNITVSFYSYFKEITGCEKTVAQLPARSTIQMLLDQLSRQFPRFGAMQNSLLIAVDVEYQDRRYVLQEGDEVSLFPPVQGG